MSERGLSKSAEADLDRAKGAVKEEVDAAKDNLQNASDRLREEAGHIAHRAKETIADRASKGKETISAGMNDVAAAVRKASEELGARDQSMVAGLVREMASGLEDASNAIHGHSLEELTQSVSDFARRRPGTFLLGATMAGIALGRFARATGERPAEPATSPHAPSTGVAAAPLPDAAMSSHGSRSTATARNRTVEPGKNGASS